MSESNTGEDFATAIPRSRLYELADELQEKAEDTKNRHEHGSWQYGQAMGFEKAALRLRRVIEE